MVDNKSIKQMSKGNNQGTGSQSDLITSNNIHMKVQVYWVNYMGNHDTGDSPADALWDNVKKNFKRRLYWISNL